MQEDKIIKMGDYKEIFITKDIISIIQLMIQKIQTERIENCADVLEFCKIDFNTSEERKNIILNEQTIKGKCLKYLFTILQNKDDIKDKLYVKLKEKEFTEAQIEQTKQAVIKLELEKLQSSKNLNTQQQPQSVLYKGSM